MAKLALLYGLKEKLRPEQAVAEDAGHAMVGAFSSPQAAEDFVVAGGLTPEFPYFAIVEQEASFWIIGSNDLTTEQLSDSGLEVFKPYLIAGPFDSPHQALASFVRTDLSGWRGVAVRCTNDDWARQCPRAEQRFLDRPDFSWALSQVPRWHAAQSPGEVAVTLAETGAFMGFATEWIKEHESELSQSVADELGILECALKLKLVHGAAHGKMLKIEEDVKKSSRPRAVHRHKPRVH